MSQPSENRHGRAGKKIAAIVMGLSVASSALAYGQHQPATPCPCAADGMCYPKRDTWGYYKTHWRAAPGESVGPPPTPAPGGTLETQEQLPDFVRPLPEEEDLRGPAKPVRPSTSAEQPAAAGQGQQPAEPAGEEPNAAPADGLDLPGLPGFGPPQGSLNPLPRIEEGPPELPRALSQALSSLPPQNSTQFATAAANPATAAAPVRSSLPVAPSRYVSPASAESVGPIELANPAAKNVAKNMDQDLHQAIYFEAADVSGDMK